MPTLPTRAACVAPYSTSTFTPVLTPQIYPSGMVQTTMTCRPDRLLQSGNYTYIHLSIKRVETESIGLGHHPLDEVLTTHNVSSSMKRAILIYLILLYGKGLGQSYTTKAFNVDRPASALSFIILTPP